MTNIIRTLRKREIMLRAKAILLALGLAALATPSSAQGAPPGGVSGQVTVINPATSPVPTHVLNPATAPALTSSVDDPGRTPYQADIFLDSCSGATECTLTLPTVPLGHRLVMQHINSVISTFNNPPTSASISLFIANFITAGFVVPTINGASVLDQPVLFYVDGGNTASFLEVIGGSTFVNGAITVTGYLLDCTVGPCAPIAGGIQRQ